LLNSILFLTIDLALSLTLPLLPGIGELIKSTVSLNPHLTDFIKRNAINEDISIKIIVDIKEIIIIP